MLRNKRGGINMSNEHNNNERRFNQYSSSELLPVRNRDTNINKSRYPTENYKQNSESIRDENYKSDPNNIGKYTGNQDHNNTEDVYNPGYFQRIANKEFAPFSKSCYKILDYTDFGFDSCWKKGKIILDGHASKEIKDKTGYLMLCLLNYSPENFDRYENEIQIIIPQLSIDVCIWYFFRISKYYFQFLSNQIQDESLQKRFDQVWKQGKFLLTSELVHKKSVKSDVAEQLLLILEVSDPELLKTMEIDVTKEINEISKHVIQEGDEIKKIEEYGFTFEQDKFAYVKINSMRIADNSKKISDAYLIQSLSMNHDFKIFTFTNVFSVFCLVFAAIIIVVF